jgi:hypothetical protein
MYTPEEEETLLAEYNGSNTDELAKLLGKSKRSIIGKLSKMGIYQKTTYRTKKNELPVTKLELRNMIESELSTDLPGLEKSPKETLKKLWVEIKRGQ